MFGFGKFLVFGKRLNAISDGGAEFCFNFFNGCGGVFDDIMQDGTLDGEVGVGSGFDGKGGDDLLADEDGVDDVWEVNGGMPVLASVCLSGKEQGAAG